MTKAIGRAMVRLATGAGEGTPICWGLTSVAPRADGGGGIEYAATGGGGGG